MTPRNDTADRTRKIRDIVTGRVVQTQADLVAALRQQRVHVTQATISRDIKRLGLVKVPAADGRYRYVLPGAAREPTPEAATRLRSVFEEFAVSVERGSDLVLVRSEERRVGKSVDLGGRRMKERRNGRQNVSERDTTDSTEI